VQQDLGDDGRVLPCEGRVAGEFGSAGVCQQVVMAGVRMGEYILGQPDRVLDFGGGTKRRQASRTRPRTTTVGDRSRSATSING
jgi:hypothetical protein